MSRIRLYLDEDTMQQGLLAALRSRRVDVVTALECGMVRHDDEEHLQYASGDGRALYSFNIGDYALIHRKLDRGRANAPRYYFGPTTILFSGRTTSEIIAASEPRVSHRNEGAAGISVWVG